MRVQQILSFGWKAKIGRMLVQHLLDLIGIDQSPGLAIEAGEFVSLVIHRDPQLTEAPTPFALVASLDVIPDDFQIPGRRWWVMNFRTDPK